MDSAATIPINAPSTALNLKLLKSQMLLKGISCKDLADAEGWSFTTTYRKVNGKVAWTVPEVQVCVEQLSLDSETASKIFFAGKMS